MSSMVPFDDPDAAPVIVPSAPIDDPLEKVKELRGLAEREIARRLRSRKLRETVPAGALLKFIIDAAKAEHAFLEDEGEGLRARRDVLIVLERARAAGLPADRQVSLIVAAIRELGPDLARERGLMDALLDLVPSEEAHKLLAIDA